MNKKLTVSLLVIGSLVILGVVLWKFFPPKTQAGLKVRSNQVAEVFLDAKRLGKTPYENGGLRSGDYTLKLSTETANWETKLHLSAGVFTIANRNFAATEASSSAEVLTLDVGEGLTVLSTPGGASIIVDDKEVGATPFTTREISPGAHQLTITRSGYVPKTIPMNINPNYKLTAQVWLAQEQAVLPETASASESAKNKLNITISSPTGWLRVRQGAGTSFAEIGRVNNGEKYQVQEEQDDWAKIKLDSGEEGWVSTQYAKKEQ